MDCIISSTGEAIAFGGSGGYVHLWSSAQQLVAVNRFSEVLRCRANICSRANCSLQRRHDVHSPKRFKAYPYAAEKQEVARLCAMLCILHEAPNQLTMICSAGQSKGFDLPATLHSLLRSR